MTAHLGGLEVPSDRVPLLGAMWSAAMWSGAMVRCQCWAPLLGAMRGGVSAHVGGLDEGAIAGGG